MNNTTRNILGTIFILIIAFCSTFIVGKVLRGRGTIDLTSNSRYTLSDGSKAIVDKLQRPLNLKLYYSKQAINRLGSDQVALFNNYYYYVRDLVRSLSRHSKGKLVLEEYDPQPYSDAAEEADRLQIQAHPLPDKDVFYFGLAVTSDTGARQVIPFFTPNEEGKVEYKIVELLDQAGKRKKTKVGVLSSLPVTGENLTPQMARMKQMMGEQVQSAWGIIKLLERSYEVQKIEQDQDKIDPSIGYLLVIHPKKFSDKTLYAIDQFVMGGGRALFFVDPFCYQDQPPKDPQNPYAGMTYERGSDINKLLSAWGVRMDAGKLVGDQELMGRISGREGPTSFIGLTQFVQAKGCFNPDHALSQSLSQVDQFIAGALTKLEGVEAQVQPLVMTTKTGNVWEGSVMELGGPMGLDPALLNQKFVPGEESRWTAAIITGKLKTAFPGGRPKVADAENGEEKDPAANPEEGEANPLAVTAEENSILVVTDVDMLTNSWAFDPRLLNYGMFNSHNSNASFLQSGLEYLAGSKDLMSVRGRQQVRPQFDYIIERERLAELEFQNQIESIKREIQTFQTELNQLQDQATKQNVGVLQAEADTKRRETEVKIRQKQGALRKVQRQAREEIESLKSGLESMNTWVIPGLILIFGVVLAYMRYTKRKVQVRGGV